MTKKNFIALADHIINENRHGFAYSPEQLRELAHFLKQQNSNFLTERWLGYIAGENGKNGGKR